MKTLILWMLVLTIAYISNAQNVNIPDINFKNALISYNGVDTDEDGEISYAEAEAKVYLNIFENSITDLTGIEAFINVDTMEIYNTQATSLDVSNNVALKWLWLSHMPTLYEVCVWEIPFPPAGVDVDTTSSPNVYFTTDCAVNIPDEYTANSTINIYPNPSDDIINIEIEYINNATIEIYNVSGNLIFSKELDSKVEKIDVSGFSKGIYVVKVTQDRAVNFGKVVVR